MSQRSVSGLINKHGSFIIRTFSLEIQILLLRSMHWSRLIFPLFTQLVCKKGSFITDTGTISLEGSNISDPLSYVIWLVGRVLCSVNSPKGIMVNNNKSTHFSASLLYKSYCQWKKKSLFWSHYLRVRMRRCIAKYWMDRSITKPQMVLVWSLLI